MEMKRLCCFSLSLLIFSCMVPTTSHAKGIGSLLKKIESKLKNLPIDTKSTLAAVKAVKEEQGKDDHKEDVSNFLEKVDSALEKFGTGDALALAAGCLDIVSGIAMAFGGPVGLGIGAVASLVSSIIGLFTEDSGQESIGDIIDSALRKYGDDELQRQATGAKRDFAESSAFISIIKKQKKLSDSDLTIIAANVPIYKFSKMLGTLENRILKGSVTSELEEAKRIVEFVLLYSQLVVMRETMLLDLSILYRKSGSANHIADAVDNANKVNKNFAKDTLTFLHNMLPEHVIIGAVYYPIKNSKTSQSIFAYAKYFGVSDPPNILTPKAYFFQNIYWSNYYICSEAYMGNHMFRGCKNLKKKNIFVNRLESGYYTMANKYRRKLYITKHAEGWGWGTLDKDPGPQGHLNFIPLKSGTYMISTERWPDYFLYMESSAHGHIRTWKGRPGPQGLWKIT